MEAIATSFTGSSTQVPDEIVRLGGMIHKETGPVRAAVTEKPLGSTGEPTLRDLSEALKVVYVTGYGVPRPAEISRFTGMTRQAASCRKGRVLVSR